MAPAPRTGVSHSMRIDAVPAPGGGLIGMTFRPGKMQRQAFTSAWDRDLARDLDAIRDWGAAAVVTLVKGWELDRYRVPRLGAEVRARGMARPDCRSGGWICLRGARGDRRRRTGCWRRRGACG